MDDFKGSCYENTYGNYLKFFKDIVESDEHISVMGCPTTWAVYLNYLNVEVVTYLNFFKEDTYVTNVTDNNRLYVESICTLRPELSDALWKSDVQWNNKRRSNNTEKVFYITNNGSFHRTEVLDYIRKLKNYTPTKRKVVLVPCAADKPYPSPLHKKVLELLPHDYYLCVATGVLGLVPQDLWDHMPNYDSAIPNEWRLFNLAREYFHKHPHEHIVCYTDYYSVALYHAFNSIGVLDNTVFVNPVKFYHDYLNLLDASNLKKLEYILEGCILDEYFHPESFYYL